MLTTLEGQSPVDAFVAGDADVVPIGYYDAGWIAYDKVLGPSLRTDPSLSVTYYGFETRRPPFDDVRVRQAFAQAVDWRRLAALDEPGSSVPATGMVPAGIPGTPAGDFLPAVRPGRRPGTPRPGRLPGRRQPRPDLVHRQRRRLRRGHHRDARGEPRRRHRVRHDGVRHVPGTARDRSAGPLEPVVGRRLSGPQRLPGRPAGHGFHGQPGWLVVRAVRRRHRGRHGGRRPGGGHRRLRPGDGGRSATTCRPSPSSYGTSFSLVRDGLAGAATTGTGILRLAGLAWEDGQ